MTMCKMLLPLAAAVLAAPAAAAPATADGRPQGAVDGYLWNGGTDTGGLGVKGHFMVSHQLFLSGLFQSGEVGNADADEMRLGLGAGQELARGVTLYGKGEIISIDVDGGIDETGFGLQGGVLWSAAPTLLLTTQIGMIDVDDGAEGSEFLYGLTWEVSRPVSLILERRESAFAGLGAETRIGASFSF